MFKLIDVSSKAMTRFAGLVIMLMTVHITADVAAKYLFNNPIDGTLEFVAAYYMVIIVFFPLAFVTHHEGHIKVELFTRAMPERRILRLESVIAVVGFLYMGLLTVGAVDEALFKTAIRDTWETADDVLEVWPSRWIVPIGCLAMTLYLVYRSAADWSASRRGKSGNSG
jgi:TRAP-type C4-dicarboxylate transport system permease small subunit